MSGPFTIKKRRSEPRRYGTFFTLIVGLVVHNELTYSFDADSFIQSLRHFNARDGNIRTLQSDNGTNFVRAEKKLWKASFEQNHRV